ncbi:hypothetical protein M0R04_11845 [Candidatus Dojkabacteria bacterium]|jgi:hypothetical protein|nr:hypothetical protein [Candidatus Dojkabacteria bacterium]
MVKKSQKENVEVKQEAPLVVNPTEKVLEKENVQTEEYNIEIIRDYYGNVDPFYLSKKDPNYHYRFLRDEHKNITLKTGNLLFQKGGWQIVPKEHLFKLGFKASELSPDGLMRRGDQILAFMPQALYLEKIKYKKEQADYPMKIMDKRLKNGDSSIGGIHDSMKGIQTQKELGL